MTLVRECLMWLITCWREIRCTAMKRRHAGTFWQGSHRAELRKPESSAQINKNFQKRALISPKTRSSKYWISIADIHSNAPPLPWVGLTLQRTLKATVTVYHCTDPQSLIVVLLRSFKKLLTFLLCPCCVSVTQLPVQERWQLWKKRRGKNFRRVEWKEGLQKPA